MNNLKTKVDDLVIGELKTFPIDLKKINDTLRNGVVKNKTFNTLNTKVNKLDKTFLMWLL